MPVEARFLTCSQSVPGPFPQKNITVGDYGDCHSSEGWNPEVYVYIVSK